MTIDGLRDVIIKTEPDYWLAWAGRLDSVVNAIWDAYGYVPCRMCASAARLGPCTCQPIRTRKCPECGWRVIEGSWPWIFCANEDCEWWEDAPK